MIAQNIKKLLRKLHYFILFYIMFKYICEKIIFVTLHQKNENILKGWLKWSLWNLYYLLNYDGDFALKSIWMINETK